MTDSLSISQAKKLILHSQKLPPVNQGGSALSATLSSIEHLGYIQIDTISVIQRAHHHTIWNRNPRYKLSHLELLVEDKKVFEYWSHAAAYLPMCDYKYSLRRKHDMKTGKQKHWFKQDKKLMDAVLSRIEAEGPLMAKDFDSQHTKKGGWGSKPAKQALETLFMQGDLMVPRRVNFHKVYDLTERVLPQNTDTQIPNEQEHARFLITRYLNTNGLGQVSEICYLLKNCKSFIISVINDMLNEQLLQKITVNNSDYYVLVDSLQLLNKPLSRSKLKILSPFDNLLIQRKRMKALFQYDYLLECYVPEAKRQYGYFCLPILWNGDLMARVDCKIDKKSATLHLLHLVIEKDTRKIDEFLSALKKELIIFSQFNHCTSIKVIRTTPSHINSALASIINE